LRMQGELEQKKDQVAQAGRAEEKAQQSLATLARELEQLETVLQGLKLLRAKRQNTYSVVPYGGRRGENRKPVYAECTPSGVIFHPDGLRLDGVRFTPLAVRGELERRIKDSMNTTAGPAQGQRPYLFLLVRPDGLESYYAVQSSLA